jgi:hypothetical protein
MLREPGDVRRKMSPQELSEYERRRSVEAEFITKVKRALRTMVVGGLGCFSRREYERVRNLDYWGFVEWLEKCIEGALEQVYRAEGNIYHPLHDVITGKPGIENYSLLPIDYNNNKVIKSSIILLK